MDGNNPTPEPEVPANEEPSPTVSDSQGNQPPGPEQPVQPEPFLARLRRSKGNQMIGGVCGGLGRETGIDPLLFRVAFVMASFVGGAGMILYIAAWMFIPEEGSDIGGVGKEFKATNDVQVRTFGMIAAGIIAFFAALGSGPWMFGNWSNGAVWALATAAIVAGLIYWIIAESKNPKPRASQPTPAWTPSATHQQSAVYSTPAGQTNASAYVPPAPKPVEPGGFKLTLLTLSTIAIAIGLLAYYAITTTHLEYRVYVAVALAITALGTLIGIRWGKPGPLITLGTVLSVMLLTPTVIPSIAVGDAHVQPLTMHQLDNDVSHGMGSLTVDLRDIDPSVLLEGETINISNGIGLTEVIVPRDVDVEVNANVGVGQVQARGLRIDDEPTPTTATGGLGNSFHHAASGDDPLVVNVSTSIGEVLVIQK